MKKNNTPTFKNVNIKVLAQNNNKQSKYQKLD